MQNIYWGFAEKGKEEEQTLLSLSKGRLARIKSCGHVSPPGYWYDQEEDEWVMVLGGEGELEWPCGGKKRLKAGDWLFIPAHQRHRVSYTSSEPPCIWLAIYGNLKMEDSSCTEK